MQFVVSNTLGFTGFRASATALSLACPHFPFLAHRPFFRICPVLHRTHASFPVTIIPCFAAPFSALQPRSVIGHAHEY